MPTAPDGEFVAAMEDVLDVYHRRYNPKFPVVCMDEASKQLIGEIRDPLPTGPRQIAKFDSEYVRNGTANIFMAVEPLAGRRTTQVKIAARKPTGPDSFKTCWTMFIPTPRKLFW